jgi:hypothetical protein
MPLRGLTDDVVNFRPKPINASSWDVSSPVPAAFLPHRAVPLCLPFTGHALPLPDQRMKKRNL